MGEHRLWPEGVKVMDRHGNFALLLGKWAQFCWVVYDGQANPVTVLGCELVLAHTRLTLAAGDGYNRLAHWRPIMPELTTEECAKILRQVVLGAPAPANESPEAAAWRKECEEDVEKQREQGAMIDIPPD